ncbi:MAG: hypothetical protein AAGD96_21095 [Chloroflexota bacterium]
MIYVYHQIFPLDSAEQLQEPIQLNEYCLVAITNTTHLPRSFCATNHVRTNWAHNRDVTAISERHRSTQMGDIFRCADGKTYLLGATDFQPISLSWPSHLQQALATSRYLETSGAQVDGAVSQWVMDWLRWAGEQEGVLRPI